MTPLVEAKGLVLGYDTHTAVAASSFSIPEGGVTAIIGPNGSGKSTLLHAIAGILTPLAGSLSVFGAPTSEAWKRCTYVMQTVNFPPGTPITVREVVGMGRYQNWMGVLAVAPLMLMLATGLYLFALPYVRRGRAAAA